MNQDKHKQIIYPKEIVINIVEKQLKLKQFQVFVKQLKKQIENPSKHHQNMQQQQQQQIIIYFHMKNYHLNYIMTLIFSIIGINVIHHRMVHKQIMLIYFLMMYSAAAA